MMTIQSKIYDSMSRLEGRCKLLEFMMSKIRPQRAGSLMEATDERKNRELGPGADDETSKSLDVGGCASGRTERADNDAVCCVPLE